MTVIWRYDENPFQFFSILDNFGRGTVRLGVVVAQFVVFIFAYHFGITVGTVSFVKVFLTLFTEATVSCVLFE